MKKKLKNIYICINPGDPSFYSVKFYLLKRYKNKTLCTSKFNGPKCDQKKPGSLECFSEIVHFQLLHCKVIFIA